MSDDPWRIFRDACAKVEDLVILEKLWYYRSLYSTRKQQEIAKELKDAVYARTEAKVEAWKTRGEYCV